MKRVVVLVAGVVILLVMPLSGISDTNASVANSVPDTDIDNLSNEAEHSSSNSSANATITITMTGAPDE